ncbi:MAG: anaerobic ribonucleoside-triphosphate reductase activating protein [Lachnospiraceae bacterium]|nr:anaerobic ribonucleoside-triphosphate reductase activating protein [Lachnospiraceae bacterium]
MHFYGMNKTTLLDYPGHVAATLFTGGCNMRCPFCQNSVLVLDPASQPEISGEEVLAFLKKRQGVLEGVCITGGEPTLQPWLEAFIRRVRQLGYLVKLDTNGYRPDVLAHLLQEGLLDYAAMDIKASREHYGAACGLPGMDPAPIDESISLLKKSGIPYEFRTTAVKGIHTPDEFAAIGQWLQGCEAYFLQNFRDSGEILQPGYDGFERSLLEEMLIQVRKYIPQAQLRGVD